MFAHFRATITLAVVFASIASAGSDVLVYLDAGSNADSVSLGYMRHETEALLRTAGYHVDWLNAHGTQQPDTTANLIVLRLIGTCAAPPGQSVAAPFAEGLSHLATTSMVDGRILPYSQVDCQSLTRLLSVPLNPDGPARRNYLYGRAMGRLVAHELYHILGQTVEHSRGGVGKQCFTLADLTAEVFEFEPGALAQLRRQAGWTTAGAAHNNGEPVSVIFTQTGR
jgi:hypothetical protein